MVFRTAMLCAKTDSGRRVRSYEEVNDELSAPPSGAGYIGVSTEQRTRSATRQTPVAGTVTYEAAQPSTQYGQ